jgi:hypothetical protein
MSPAYVENAAQLACRTAIARRGVAHITMASEEATRRGAEDIPIGAPERELEDLPVFDRADALPKV